MISRRGLHILAAVIKMEFFKCNVLLLAGGALYCAVELLWRRRTHISMFFVGGLCFVLVGLLDELAPRLPFAMQLMLGAAVITGLELVSGLIVNRLLKLSVWDYSGIRDNFLGQICLPFFSAWLALAALAVPADNLLRLLLFSEPWPPVRLF